MRRCIVTRERQEKAGMIRFVIAPDRAVVADLAGRLPGRGLWLSARRDVVEVARGKGAFARAARGAVTVPPDLVSALIAALERRVADHIGLARRAGQAVAGFTKARDWLEMGRVGLMVHAADGSDDECRRLLSGHAGRVPVARVLDGTRLGALFGREHAVHVAVAAGRLADALRVETGRLAGLTNAPPAGTDVTRGPRSSRKMERDQAST